MRVWRITRAAHAAFDGEGTRRHGSRWTRRGTAVVYASATLSLAALELLVHADSDLLPDDLVAIAADIDTDEAIESVDVEDLPGGWRDYPAPEALVVIGDRWLQRSRTIVLAVPSVVVPHERNYLLHPRHEGFRSVTVHRPEPFSLDARLRRR